MQNLHSTTCSIALAAGIAIAPSAALASEVPGVGWEGQGADAVLLQVDANPRPDLILMAYDNPSRDNSFRYKVGFNVDANGDTANWSGFIQIPGLGWEGQGAGAATADLDNNGRPELIFMAYDNPQRDNNFRYTVGWNLNAAGVATNWTTYNQVPGVGWEGQGAAVVIGQIDSNPRPDMLFIAYDNPARDNQFRYRVGLNVDTQGNANWSPNIVAVPGVGWEGQGLGAALVNADGNARPDLALIAYDNPSRDNNFRSKIGFNLDSNGVAQSWQPGFDTFPGLGWEGQGAGLAVGCLDGDARADWLIMAYDNPSRDNSFRYFVSHNRSNPPCSPTVGVASTNLRKSITALSAQEIDSLRRGFARMRAWSSAPRDSADYRRSLQYWANMHSYVGDNCAPTGDLTLPGMTGLSVQAHMNESDKLATWCKCEHGTRFTNNLQFLTWHRMYLYYFEQVLQAAADDSNLRLPYFDYGANGQLPLIYREGTTASNPLRTNERLTSLNNGSGTIDSFTASASNAMAATDYATFNRRLEQGPHGPVHCTIGVASCPSGYMGHVPTSGNDPIFYSHHSNIDRLYECWLRVDPAARRPTDAAQLARTYSFPDGAGNVVTRTVADMVTTAQLNYGYAGGSSCPPIPLSLTISPEILASVLRADLAGPVRLNRGTTRIPLRVTPDVHRRLLTTSPGRGATELSIEGLTFDEPPHVNYRVFLAGAGGRRAFLGVISFFGLAEHRHEGADTQPAQNATFDITAALREIGAPGEGGLNLVIEPSTGITEEGTELAARRINPRANVRFGAIRAEVKAPASR